MRRAAALLIAIAAVAAQASAARAEPTFRPRIGGALGIVPRHGSQEIAAGANLPVVFHGGVVMHNVTVHAVFWAPAGHTFDGPPTLLTQGYVPLIQQFLADVAHDSGGAGNEFSVLRQYPDILGPAGYGVSYTAAADAIYDTAPYPTAKRQCASPSGTPTCITDLELQKELDKVISAHDPRGRGLHDVWFIFLPPDVDTCIAAGECGTNAYAGYHSLSNLGHGPVIYVPVPDPQIEFTPVPGDDPEGNPEAESTIDTVAHELVEAITDPVGTGWMDPNGYEVADKCEDGPQQGTPLGYSLTGSPYNQVIDGHPYLLQGMWSNARLGCVEQSGVVIPNAGLATVSLRQFSSLITGEIGRAVAGVGVHVELIRAGTVVATADTRTRPTGAWGPARLRARTGRRFHGHARDAFGDDRDAIRVTYGPGGPPDDLIRTGDGGNPFTESGYTGWFDLDNGYARVDGGILISPCSQVGVLAVTAAGRQAAPPAELCETETDVAPVALGRVGKAATVTFSSEDNRAISAHNPFGALVSLTVPVGETGSVSAATNDQILIDQTGFPACTANLDAETVSCAGLVPGARYSLLRSRGHVARRARAHADGRLSAGLPVRGGDQVALRNPAGRVLTILHVVHLRAALTGNQTVLAGGSCEPGEYWGPPVGRPPLGPAIDVPGVTGSGRICPLSGRAKGLPAVAIEQTDDRSGGMTRTQVPALEGFVPGNGATLYGGFVALGRPDLPGPHGSLVPAQAAVSLTVTAASGRTVLRLGDVARPGGIRVPALAPGAYQARWVVRDRNGDTRVVSSQFVEAG